MLWKRYLPYACAGSLKDPRDLTLLPLEVFPFSLCLNSWNMRIWDGTGYTLGIILCPPTALLGWKPPISVPKRKPPSSQSQPFLVEGFTVIVALAA